MSCMESGPPGEDHRLSTSVRHNNGELLAQVGPTASSIAEGNLSTHERWHLNHFVYKYHYYIGGYCISSDSNSVKPGLTICMDYLL